MGVGFMGVGFIGDCRVRFWVQFRQSTRGERIIEKVLKA